METSRKPKFGKRPGPGTLFRKLEQDHHGLVSLQRHLKSYACEPRTPKLFEKREELFLALETMKRKSKQLLMDLRIQKKDEIQPEERFRMLHRLYQDLENKVLAYIGEARQFA